MDNYYIKELIEYSSLALKKISENDTCVGLIINKPPSSVSDFDKDFVLDNNLFDYQYVDKANEKTNAYVWVESEIASMQSESFKDIKIYITVACHKDYMKLDTTKFKGMMGNRRDNLAKCIDSVIQDSDAFGLGKLKLSSVLTVETTNNVFTARLLTYCVPEFKIKKNS